jgi:hypothetical protein
MGAVSGGTLEAAAGAGLIAYGAIDILRKVNQRRVKDETTGTILDIVAIGAGFWLMENSGMSFSQLLSDVGGSSVAQAVGL